MFDFPGGFADYGEPIEKTVIREIHEELGIKIKNPRYPYLCRISTCIKA